jgi:glycerate dehydrogenase
VGDIAHAMGMNVVAHTRSRKNPPPYQPFAWRALAELIGESDVITLHCPQTPETAGIVNADFLALMKPTAFLINAARGGLVNEAALAKALNQGTIGGAAVDVASAEPIRPDNPLLTPRNCIITPHIAWATLDARRRIMQTTARNIAAFLAGNPVNVVNR